jgi:hypothetical protein
MEKRRNLRSTTEELEEHHVRAIVGSGRSDGRAVGSRDS